MVKVERCRKVSKRIEKMMPFWRKVSVFDAFLAKRVQETGDPQNRMGDE